MMKKTSLCLLAVLLLLLTAMPVCAAKTTYDLDELGLQVDISAEYTVITRDTPADDPVFSYLEITKAELMDIFEMKNICLNAVSDLNDEEVVVTMTEVPGENFSKMSDAALTALMDEMIDRFNSNGYEAWNGVIYQHPQTKFLKFYFKDAAGTVHGLQYSTVHNGKAMNFTFRSYEGALDTREKYSIKTIVDSIRFDNTPLLQESGEDTDPFVYTDEESGLHFTVPANWKQEAFSKDREVIDVKFVSTKESGGIIIYGSEDLWGQMSALERAGSSRKDMNNSLFTKADIAEMYGTTQEKVSTVTYNGVQYFKCEIETSYDVYGVDLLITMTQLIHIDNGWAYTFMFGSAGSDELYSDFESLVSSVQYPETEEETGSAAAPKTAKTEDQDSGGNFADVALLLLIVSGLVAVGVIILVKNRKKEVEYPDDPPAPQETAIYCRHCGKKLPEDSIFCNYCGTKVVK